MVEQREIFHAEFKIVYVDTLLSRRQNVTSHSKSRLLIMTSKEHCIETGEKENPDSGETRQTLPQINTD